MDKNEILYTLQANREELKRFGVSRIGLFGSYAKGSSKSESDIDLIVEFESGQKTFDNFMDLKFYLEDLFGREVDLVTKESIKPGFKENIMKSVEYAWL